jgi:hypothetical protein
MSQNNKKIAASTAISGATIAVMMMMMLGMFPTAITALAQIPGMMPSQNAPSAPQSQSSSPTLASAPQSLSSPNLTGAISSLQNNPEGNPAWIVQGQWNMSLAKPLAQSQPNPTANTFDSSYTMEMLNGTAKHRHVISDFKQTSSSMNGNTAATINGTATITMKEGPVQNVPISIKLMQGNALNLWIDPTKTNNHFGNTPIYGTVFSRAK